MEFEQARKDIRRGIKVRLYYFVFVIVMATLSNITIGTPSFSSEVQHNYQIEASAIGIIYMLSIFGLAFLSGHKAEEKARKQGEPEAEARYQSVIGYVSGGVGIAMGPGFQILWIGWLWALPFFLPYLLYWYLLYRRWQWYRAALA